MKVLELVAMAQGLQSQLADAVAKLDTQEKANAETVTQLQAELATAREAVANVEVPAELVDALQAAQDRANDLTAKLSD